MTLLTSCVRCGTQIPADAAFCFRCGFSLSGETPASSSGDYRIPTPVHTPSGTATTGVGAGDLSPDLVSRFAAALASQYRVVRELGHGGMATVYLAEDAKHGREVAIKVLHADLGASIGSERFEREIRLAAQLQHPHILGLYDSGSAEGLLYYVMPFVKGESLRDRLAREGQLPIDDAIRITLEVADALAHAHKRGIVHRDIKPENILLTDEHALVADFGIAKAASEAGQNKLTQTGMAVGTPVYMAPEQASGETVGPTADIYSLGCVLYEMLAGDPPFTGKNAMALMAKHAMEQVPSIRIVRQSVPEEVEEAIFMAMGKSPADRPQTAAQFAELLGIPLTVTAAMRTGAGMSAVRRTTTSRFPAIARRLPWWRRMTVVIPAAVVLAGLATAAVLYQRSDAAVSLGPDDRRVAVLYLEDRSRDSSLAPLASGLTEGLMEELSSSPSLTVVSRSGVEAFRGSDLSADSIARALRAGYLVRGEVEPEGSNVRVSVRLDDASGVNLRRASFVIAMRANLTEVASDMIRRQLGAELELSSQRASTSSSQAWLMLQRGEQQRRLGEERAGSGDMEGMAVAFATADSLFAHAENLDGRWVAPVVARAGVAYRRSRVVGRDPAKLRPWIELGINHANRALALNPRDADALEIRGNLQYWAYLVQLEADPVKAKELLEAARRDLEEATTVNPRQAGAFASLSHLYNQVNSPTDVAIAAQRALEADEFLTNADVVLNRLFTASYDLGQFDKADQWCKEIGRRYPNSQFAVRCQLFVLTGRDKSPDTDRAWTLADSVVALTPAPRQPHQRKYADMLVAQVIARAAAGQPALADSAVRVITRSAGDATLDPARELPFLGARAYVILGRYADAVRLLKEHFAANPGRVQTVRDDPGWWFRDLSGDREYRALVGSAR
jgi:eukaryotic-like serine/threonine-protein kinase